MCLLIETILCIDGQLKNIEWHNYRLNNSRRLLLHKNDKIFLERIKIPNFVNKGNWKCKVLYSDSIKNISFEAYIPRRVKTLALVESTLDYSHKYNDREKIDELFNKRGKADEIIIIKDGFVTDSSIANILFYNGKNWITSNTPLLEGTMRAQLIHKDKIKVETVKKSDLKKFSKLMLVNAMNPFNEKNAMSLHKSVLKI